MSSVLRSLRQRRRSRGIGGVVLAQFLLRAVIPVGYMPAAMAEGGPFALCHGLSAATIELIEAARGDRDTGPQHAHHHPDESDEPDGAHDDRWAHCPLGAGVPVLPIADVPGFGLAPTPATLVRADRVAPLAANRFRSYLARAPPA